MNRIKSILTATVLASATSGLLVATDAAASASSTKDVSTTSGSCSRQADYTYRLADYGTYLNLVRVKFDIDSNKNNRDWTLKVYRNGHLKRTLHETTGSRGNAYFDAHMWADDDAKIKVYAHAGYGEHCTSTQRLDTPS